MLFFFFSEGNKIVEQENKDGGNEDSGNCDIGLFSRSSYTHNTDCHPEIGKSKAVGEKTEAEDTEDIFFIPFLFVLNFQDEKGEEQNQTVYQKVHGENQDPCQWKREQKPDRKIDVIKSCFFGVLMGCHRVPPFSPLGFFAFFDLGQIGGVDPFLGEATETADIAVDVDGGEDGLSYHYVIACAVGTRVTVDSDDVGALAFGTAFGCFHNTSLFGSLSGFGDGFARDVFGC